MKRKFLSFLLILLVSSAANFAQAESGTCGTNLTWELSEGTLTILGTGAMNDFGYGGAPWYSLRNAITTVKIEDGVTSIGDMAFYACTNFKSVTIPASVERIGMYAFIYCYGLESITIPGSVENMELGAFSDCINLKSVTLLDGLTSIGTYAFFGCTSLKSVTIPESMASIGGSAFYHCTKLESVMIPNGVTSIGSQAFADCFSLTSVTIPEGLESIEEFTFYACGFESITIPASVKIIKRAAFYACDNLTEIVIKAETPPLLEENVFSDILFADFIYVPCGAEESYKAADWGLYRDKVAGEVPDITLKSNDDDMGEAVIKQKNTCSSDEAIIEANAGAGHYFVKWNDGGRNNPRTITVTEDTTFTAEFSPIYPLVLRKDLEDAVVCLGGSHTFEIEAEGEELTYEWYYRDQLILRANTNSYTVTNANHGDYGIYHVVVRGKVGDLRMSVYSKNVRLWVADQLPETLSFVSCPVQAVTGETYHIKLAGYSDVTQYIWSYRVGATLVVAQNTVAQNTNDGVTFSPATGGVGQNETLATFGALSVGQGLLTATLTHPCGTRQATQAIVVQYPTGVEQVAETAIRVFPNPTTGIVKVSGTKSNQIIRIVDIAGSLKGDYPAQDGETTIDLVGFTKGIYLVHYDGKAFKVVRK
ncbi:MAG: leucine-rich repeat protein [Dysgonamonadaceae bacterium]|nr:leucine-rich repeat protein [Dysgonamonadaceae bacterium]